MMLQKPIARSSDYPPISCKSYAELNMVAETVGQCETVEVHSEETRVQLSSFQGGQLSCEVPPSFGITVPPPWSIGNTVIPLASAQSYQQSSVAIAAVVRAYQQKQERHTKAG
jgi:hypothetical protein